MFQDFRLHKPSQKFPLYKSAMNIPPQDACRKSLQLILQEAEGLVQVSSGECKPHGQFECQHSVSYETVF